jgi:hypothetical protein
MAGKVRLRVEAVKGAERKEFEPLMESPNGRFSMCGLSQSSGGVAEGRLMPPEFRPQSCGGQCLDFEADYLAAAFRSLFNAQFGVSEHLV